MSKLSNQWEVPLRTVVPYLQWHGDSKEEAGSWDISRHNHASCELHIILDGECSLSVGDAEVVLQTGQGILIMPEAFHAPNRVSETFRRFTMQFLLEPELASQLLTPDHEGFCVFDPDETIRSQCNAISGEDQQTSGLLHRELLSCQLAQLVILVLRAIKDSPEHAVSPAPDSKQLEDMDVIDRFFVTTAPAQRSKENLARLLHCSERQLLRKIYTLYGMSFREKLILSRVDTARHLLRSTDKSIEEISSIVGYSDNAAFYRAFKLHTNTTPVRFRKQERIKGTSKQ